MQTETTQRKIKAFPIYTGSSGCDYHRIKLPFLFAFDYYDDDAYKGFDLTNLLHYVELSELLCLNRLLPIGYEVLKKWKSKYNFKLAVDLDDWIRLPDYHPNYQQYKREAGKQILDTIAIADVVTVTTDRLYNRIKEYHSNCHVIPNALPFGKNQFVEKPPQIGAKTYFNCIYTGQSSHLEDVRIMQADIYRASKLPGISFALAGYKTGGLAGRVWNAIERVFDQGAIYNRIPARGLDDYMTVYDNADCALVPLCINDFNSHKSNLKILEAACKKIPAIVSHVPPYRDDPEAPVWWVKEPSDWYKHIKYLSENRSYAADTGEELYQWAKEKYDLIKWNKVRFELYQSVIK